MPFTCGSQLRRSLIKYFYRNYSKTLGADGLRVATTSLLNQTVHALYARWTNLSNFGCKDAATGLCSFAACASTNYYAPCLDTTAFKVSRVAM